MILISVKSPVVDDKRQFKTDAAAFRFLKRIDKLHMLHRIHECGDKPKFMQFKKLFKGQRKSSYLKALRDWNDNMRVSVPLRIEIINTKFNQLNLPIK